MRVTAKIIGDLRQMLAEEVAAGARAATQAVREETETLKRELRAQVMSTFGAKGTGLANAWRSQVYPSSGVSLHAAGLVWSKVPLVIDAFERGALIQVKGGGRFLAIATGFNATRGWRGRGDKGLRVTPAQMVASGQAFLRPFRSGAGFVWCLPLRQGEQTRTGRTRNLRLIAGGMAEVATGHRKGRETWARGLLAQGLVPMFLLLPQVRLAKRLDVDSAARRAGARVPQRFVALWHAETGEAP